MTVTGTVDLREEDEETDPRMAVRIRRRTEGSSPMDSNWGSFFGPQKVAIAKTAISESTNPCLNVKTLRFPCLNPLSLSSNWGSFFGPSKVAIGKTVISESTHLVYTPSSACSNWGSFFGPSKVAIAKTVVDAERIRREAQAMAAREAQRKREEAEKVRSGSKASAAGRQGGAKKAPEAAYRDDRRMLLAEEEAKRKRLKENRDFSFLFSTDSKQKPPPSRSQITPPRPHTAPPRSLSTPPLSKDQDAHKDRNGVKERDVPRERDGHRDKGMQRDGEGYRGAGSIGHSSGSAQQQRPLNRAAGAGGGAGGMGATGGGRGVVRPGDGRGAAGGGAVSGRGGMGAVGGAGRGGGGGGMGGSGRIGIGDIVRRDGDDRRLDGRDKADRGSYGAYGMGGRGGGYDDRPMKKPQPGSAPPNRTQPPPMSNKPLGSTPARPAGMARPKPGLEVRRDLSRMGAQREVDRGATTGRTTGGRHMTAMSVGLHSPSIPFPPLLPFLRRNHRENHMGPAYDSDDDDNMEVGFSQLMAEERRR
ncbi:unnamed protein product [Closterium sp. Yama58-4]|nr:unnamed protein product [Closterium sp. Yama58-4]